MERVQNEMIIQIRNGELRMGEDGIVYGAITVPGTVQEPTDAEQITKATEQLVGTKKALFYVDVRNLIFVDAEAIGHFIGPEHAKLVKALALRVDASASLAMSRFFVEVYRPPFPTKVFTSKSEAVRWLKTFNAQSSAGI